MEVEVERLVHQQAAVGLQLHVDVRVVDLVLLLLGRDVREEGQGRPGDPGDDHHEDHPAQEGPGQDPPHPGPPADGGSSTAGATAASEPALKNSRLVKPKAEATSDCGKTATAVLSVSTVSL